jgi:hypothetical protein
VVVIIWYIVVGFITTFFYKQSLLLPGADLGFVVRGDVSRRGIWGPLKVPSGSRGAKAPGSSGGLRNYRHLFERQF